MPATETPITNPFAVEHRLEQLVKAQLPLKEPRKYNRDRKNGACEQWCMDMWSFLEQFKRLTRAKLDKQQAVEYVSQYLGGTALTWWTNLQF